MSNVKVKGLLKGLRYISQIFDNEKEPEMQIGYPTDVKHVAHIGWDGPSVDNSPSWMREFKSPTGFSSAPLSPIGDMKEDDSSVKWVSQDSARRGSRAAGDSSIRSNPDQSPRGLPENERPTRRHSSTGGSIESPRRDESDKPRQTRRSSRNSTKDSQGGTKPSKGCDSLPDLPDIPKKTRRKKAKDPSVEGSSSRTLRSKHQAKEADESVCSCESEESKCPVIV